MAQYCIMKLNSLSSFHFLCSDYELLAKLMRCLLVVMKGRVLVVGNRTNEVRTIQKFP